MSESIQKYTRGWRLLLECTCEESLHTLACLTGISLPAMQTVDFWDPKEE